CFPCKELFAEEKEEAEAIANAESHRTQLRKSRAFADEEGDAAEIARHLEQKYKDYGKEIDIDLDAEGRSDIAQQSFLPSVIDPKLWLVRCKVGQPFFPLLCPTRIYSRARVQPGKEREIVVCLMQKYLDTEDTANRLLIKSAVCCDNLKGF